MILIVEDDEDTLEAYKELLQTFGFGVTGARTGAEALEAARTTRFDAILLDLTLPDIDGRDLWDHLQRGGSSGPVLALTGHTLEPGDAAAFTHTMRKPVDLDKVVEWLRKVVSTSVGAP